jgi:heme A synthase
MSASVDGRNLSERGFVRLIFGAVVVTFAMIVIGAVTRVTESGYGCGPYWPSCNGHLIPEFHDMTVVIEFGHRLFALVVGGFTFAVAYQAWKRYRHIPRIFNIAMFAVALFFVQSALGAVTVALYQFWPSGQWASVIIHLGNSMFLLATFLVLWVNARTLTTSAPRTVAIPPSALLLGAALSFLVAMIGGIVAGTNATKACIGWPLCGNEVWPSTQGTLQMLNMLHRLVAGALGVMLILMMIQVRSSTNTLLRGALWTAFAVYMGQAVLGAAVVLVENRDWLVVSRSLHVFGAALTWAAMITASAIAWLQRLPEMKNVRPVGAVTSSVTISN